MKKKGKYFIHIVMWAWLLISYIDSIISSYANGKQITFYLLLTPIPLIFVCWGINTLLSGKDIRDISKNLTSEEKRQLTRQATSHGSKIGLFLAAPFAIACGCLYAFKLKVFWPYIVLFCLFMIILVAIMIRQSRKMRIFMYSTDYGAKLANHRSHSIAGFARSR